MSRTIVLLLLLLAPAAFAEEKISDEFRFVLTLPEGEHWMQGNVQRLPGADMALNLVNMDTRQAMTVVVIPRIPAADLMMMADVEGVPQRVPNPALLSRIVEILSLQGFTVISHAPAVVNGVEFLQFVTRRADESGIKMIGVARAILRDHSLYVVLTAGRGDADRASDKQFLRVIDTFRLMDSGKGKVMAKDDPLFHHYRSAYIGCLASAGALLVLFTFTMFGSRRKHD